MTPYNYTSQARRDARQRAEQVLKEAIAKYEKTLTKAGHPTPLA